MGAWPCDRELAPPPRRRQFVTCGIGLPIRCRGTPRSWCRRRQPVVHGAQLGRALTDRQVWARRSMSRDGHLRPLQLAKLRPVSRTRRRTGARAPALVPGLVSLYLVLLYGRDPLPRHLIVLY